MSLGSPKGSASSPAIPSPPRFTALLLTILGLTASIVAGLYQPLSDAQRAEPSFWGRLSAIVGWAYFLAWSVSFYPQVYVNYVRRSVVGLSFDYQLLNLVGFSCYAVFNVSTFFPTSIRDEYESAHGGSSPTVEANDVFFALHAVTLTIVNLLQIYSYERGGQRFSRWSVLVSLTFSIFVAAYAAACAIGDDPTRPRHLLSWLSWSTSLSVIKLIVTCLKYFPQAILNYRRRSTEGWSIANVTLDFAGGVLSVAQAFMDCSLSGDWSSVTGNPVKFGLGFVSIVFDVIFMFQHYVLYPRREDGSLSSESPSSPLLGLATPST